jgi:hypothetical protein
MDENRLSNADLTKSHEDHHGTLFHKSTLATDRRKSLGLLSWLKQLSVELSALLFVTANAGCRLIFEQLLYEKCCLHQLNYTQDVCDHLFAPENQDAETAVQKLAADYNMYDSIIENVIPVFAALFIGNWTDKYGRKPMIVFCFLTKILQQIGLILNVVYMCWNPIYMSVISTLPSSFGSFTTFLMLVFSFVGDTTTTERRTVRMTILNLFMFAGQPIGNLAGGAIFEHFGYSVTFCSFTAICVLGLVYSIWKLDSLPPGQRTQQEVVDGSGNINYSQHGSKEKFKEMFRVLENGKESLRTFTRRRDGHNRLVLMLMGSSLLIGLLPIYGEWYIQVCS